MKQRTSFFFEHDYGARNDQQILQLRGEYGLEGYGLYWCMKETMAENPQGVVVGGAIGGLSVGYGLPKARVIEIADFCVKIELFKKDENGNYFCQDIMEHKEYRHLCSVYGAKGAIKRWKDAQKKPPYSPPLAIKKEIQTEKKEIKEKQPQDAPQTADNDKHLEDFRRLHEEARRRGGNDLR